MSDLYTHPAAGIAQLTIETIGRNGVLRAEPDATEIQIVASSAEAATAAEKTQPEPWVFSVSCRG